MEACVGQGGDNAICPVEILRGHTLRGVGEIRGELIHICVQRDQGIKHVRTEGHPLDAAQRLRHVRTNLQDSKLAIAIDADWTIGVAARRSSLGTVAVVRRALEVGGKNVLDVLYSDFALGHAAPRNIIRLRAERRIRTIPAVARIEAALHVPGARRVVDMVGI